MKQEIDNNLLADCFKAAMNVEYISNSRDFRCMPMHCTMHVYGEERQNKKRTTRTTR